MQLTARASCAGRPRLLSTRPAARAARSRSQRGALRAAAYPAESSPAAAASACAAAAAAAAVAELRQLVTRPRLNKQLVLKQLQVVETYLSVLAKDAALVAAQKDAALVAAQTDAALVAAQKDVALVATQKDAALVAAQKEAALAVAQKDATLVAAQKEAALAVAQKDAALAVVRKDFEVMEMKLQGLVRDLLEVTGMLHARGLLEYAEYRLFAPLSPTAKQDRMSKWQQLGQRHPKLQECILKANPSWSAHSIPDRVVQLYSHLSAQVHPGTLSCTGKVLLVEGPLNREALNLLECLARALHCPYEVRYKQLPAAIELSEQPAAGTEGEQFAAGTEGAQPAADA